MLFVIASGFRQPSDDGMSYYLLSVTTWFRSAAGKYIWEKTPFHDVNGQVRLYISPTICQNLLSTQP